MSRENPALNQLRAARFGTGPGETFCQFCEMAPQLVADYWHAGLNPDSWAAGVHWTAVPSDAIVDALYCPECRAVYRW